MVRIVLSVDKDEDVVQVVDWLQEALGAQRRWDVTINYRTDQGEQEVEVDQEEE